MIPPTLQKLVMYSDQLLNNKGMAIIAFFGKYLVKIGFIYSIKSIFGSSYFFFKAYNGLI